MLTAGPYVMICHPSFLSGSRLDVALLVLLSSEDLEPVEPSFQLPSTICSAISGSGGLLHAERSGLPELIYRALL